jgi:hypothetical protein
MVACAAIALGPNIAVPAAHAAATTVWLGNPQNSSYWFIEPGGQLDVTFGVNGPGAATDPLVLDASGTSGHLSLASAGDPDCTIAGKVATCQPSPCCNPESWSGSVYLVADTGTPLDQLGPIIVRDQAGAGSARGTVWGRRQGVGADLEIDTTSPAGRVGDTVQVQVTVRNLGPNPEPYWGVNFLTPPFATYLGVSGCSPVALGGGTYQCGRAQPQAAGTATTFALSYRITGQAAQPAGNSGGMNLFAGIDDPNNGNSNGYFVIKAAGSGGSGGGSGVGGSGGSGQAAAGIPSAATSAAAMPPADAASPTPPSSAAPVEYSTTDSATPVAASRAAVASRPVSSTGTVGWAVGAVLLAGLVAGAVVVIRRRRSSAEI